MSSGTGSLSSVGIKVALMCPGCGGTNHVHLYFSTETPNSVSSQTGKVAYLMCRSCYYESTRIAQTDAFVLVGWNVLLKMMSGDGGRDVEPPDLKGAALQKIAGMFGWKVA